MLDYNIAKDLVSLSADISSKARYMALSDPDPAKRNWEQQQAPDKVLEDAAKKLDYIIAKYFIFYQLFNDTELKKIMSRQCSSAIRQEIKRKHASSS